MGTALSIPADTPVRCTGIPRCPCAREASLACPETLVAVVVAAAMTRAGAGAGVLGRGCVRAVIHVEIWDLESLDTGDASHVWPRHFWVWSGSLCSTLEQLHLLPKWSHGSPTQREPYEQSRREPEHVSDAMYAMRRREAHSSVICATSFSARVQLGSSAAAIAQVVVSSSALALRGVTWTMFAMSRVELLVRALPRRACTL